MDLKQLEYFVKVAEQGGFTRASVMLNVAQPALSKQIRRLEVELRQTLLKRNGRGISITEQGALFLEHAKGIIEQAERARQVFHNPDEPPAGKIVIATPSITGKALIAGFITEFRRKFPRASLEIVEAKSRFILEWLLNGRVDIGILYDPPESPQLEIVPLLSQKLSLISLASKTLAAKSKPVQFKDLAKFPLILASHPDRIRTLVETEAARIGIKLDIVLQIDGAALILELVQRGHGYTILPRFSLQRDLGRKLQANDIVNPRLGRSLTVAVSVQRPVTRLARASIELIRQCLGRTKAMKT